MLTVDRETCTQCGACVDVCGLGLLELDQDGYPSSISNADPLCNRCGACSAVCPTGSLAHNDLPLDEFSTVEKSLVPDLAQLNELMKTRRSFRVYQDKPIPRAIIERLIDSTRQAPTGMNVQDVRWAVYDNERTMNLFRQLGAEFVIQAMKAIPAYSAIAEHFEKRSNTGIDIFLHGAPVVVAAHSDAAGLGASQDCTIALAYLDLAANSVGLGCCWLGFFTNAANNYAPIRDIAGIPPGHQIFGSIVMGYPKYRYPRAPVRNPSNISWI